jgi:hypothetical protein
MMAIALAGLLYWAVHEDIANVAKTEVVRDSELPASSQASVEANVESPKKSLTNSSASDVAPLVITWRELPHANFPFPNGTPLENYNYYKSLAESGDGFAAYQLAEMMRSCSNSFLTREELDAAVVQLRETFTYFNRERNAVVRLGEQADVTKFTEMKIQQYENCQAFSAEQRQEHKYWLELAANSEYPVGMLDYGRQLDNPQAALQLYRHAWQQGNADALLSLAEALGQMYGDGIDPAAKVPAYAAMHAFVTLLRAAHGSDPERVVGRWTLRNQARLDEMAQEMLPDELEAAEQLSRQMIISNENCCFAM